MWLPLNEKPSLALSVPVTFPCGVMEKCSKCSPSLQLSQQWRNKTCPRSPFFPPSARCFFFASFILKDVCVCVCVISPRHLAALLQWEMPAAATWGGKVSWTKSAHVHRKTCRRHVLSRGEKKSLPVQTGITLGPVVPGPGLVRPRSALQRTPARWPSVSG